MSNIQPRPQKAVQFSYSHKNILKSSDNYTGDLTTIYDLISNPKLKAKFVQVQNMTRTLYEGCLTKKEAEKLKSQIDFLKKDLGFYFPSGTNDKGHLGQNLNFNGCIGFDYDFRFRGGDLIAQGLKEALKSFDFVSLLHFSSGGYGLKGIIQTDLKECDTDLYRFAEAQIFSYLSTEGVSFQHDPHGYGKICYFAYDKQPYVNLDAQPFHIDLEAYAQQKAVKLAQNHYKTTVKHSEDEVKQSVEFLIENKINVATCYNEYLSFTAACLNTFGTEGGGIALKILENSEQFNVSTFKRNFDSHVKSLSKPTNGNRATERSILFHARENGFRYKEAVKAQPFNHIFNHLDLFIVNRQKALQRVKMDRSNKVIVCESWYVETVVNELNAKCFDGRKIDVATLVCTYSDLSKLGMVNENIYYFGSQNLNRQSFINTANEIEKLSKHAKTILFSDTPIYLSIANKTTVIDRNTPNTCLVISEKPQATFVEMIRKQPLNDVQFCETSESINKQLTNYQLVKRSELCKADHSKTLYVLYDRNAGLLPEAFTQFDNVVFIVNSEKKAYITMSAFCAKMDKDIAATLQFTDTNFCFGAIEKALFEDVKRKKIPIRYNNGQWERCPNTEGVLENEHQIKILVSDATALQSYIERISVSSKDLAYITEETETISESIKEAKKELAEEKKTEFFDFLDKVESFGISSLDELVTYVSSQESMNRGAKIAYNRLKTLLKLNYEFTICFDAIKDSYNRWTQMRGRFRASKVINTNTKTGKSLQAFRDNTDGIQYSKPQLIEVAKTFLPLVGTSEKEVWKQLKTYCFVTAKKGRQDGKVMWLYETLFIE